MSLALVPPVRPWRGFRGMDSYGSGVFGATRDGGARRHLGRDLITVPGDLIICPFPAKLTRTGYAYPDMSLHLVAFEGLDDFKGWSGRLLYVQPTVNPGAVLAAGEEIGTAEDVTAYYRTKHPGHVGDITCHVHAEISVPHDIAAYFAQMMPPEIQRT